MRPRSCGRRVRRLHGRRSESSLALGRSSVASIASSVDLPAPFGPSRPTMLPRGATKETRETARRRPK